MRQTRFFPDQKKKNCQMVTKPIILVEIEAGDTLPRWRATTMPSIDSAAHRNTSPRPPSRGDGPQVRRIRRVSPADLRLLRRCRRVGLGTLPPGVRAGGTACAPSPLRQLFASMNYRRDRGGPLGPGGALPTRETRTLDQGTTPRDP